MAPEEETHMADLARAIIDLAKAAEGRRGARKQLLESTNVVARQIRSLLRTGDKISVPVPEENRRVLYECVRMQWVDQRDGKAYEEEVLARGDAILEDTEAKPKGWIARAGRPINALHNLRFATADERLAF